MGLRLPTERVNRSPHDRAVCEDVFDGLVRQCGMLMDRDGLETACDGDPALIRYARDVLALFASLEQVEHVRRDLWIVRDGSVRDPRTLEFLRAAAAVRALGPWTVIAGAWALVLRGVLDPRHAIPGCRFGLSPRPRKLASYSARGRERKAEVADIFLDPATAQRHVTVIGGAPIATVARPADKIGTVGFLEHDGLGAHVLDVPDAFVSLLEHPRLSGGVDAARAVVLPVLAHVGIEDVLDVGARHPCIAVRRRLAFVLVDALARSEGTTSWFGADEFGFADDLEQAWRIQRGLDLRLGSRPTLLDPHRLPVGRQVTRCAVVDNRSAAIAKPTRGPNGVSLRDQVAVALERARAEAHELEVGEVEAMERRAIERAARWNRLTRG